MGNVKISVQGLAGLTCMGARVTYGINQIPTCQVIIDPAAPDAASLLDDPDSLLRRNACDITLSVDSPDMIEQITFRGLFDGISTSQTIGSTQITACFKSQFQYLLETYTKIPGLNAMGSNPFQRLSPFIKNIGNAGSGSFESLLLGAGLSLDGTGQNPYQFYLNLAKFAFKVQTGNLSQLTGTPPGGDSNGIGTLIDLLKTTNYQAGAQTGALLLNQFDTSIIGAIPSTLTATAVSNISYLFDTYLNNSDVMWDNLCQFYNALGVNLVVGNTKVFMLPDNGFLTPVQGAEGTTNQALSSEFLSWNYDSNGWKDVGLVALIRDYGFTGTGIGTGLGSRLPMFVGAYPPGGENPVTRSSGMVVLRQHPFMFYDAAGYNEVGNCAKRTATMTPDMTSNYPSASTWSGGKVPWVPTLQQSATTGDDVLTNVANNYAQTKLYQLRYGDRVGSITLPLNSNWAPGACGVLETKQGGVYCFFFVQSVTHELSISSSNTGNATTTVVFSCGRVGTNPLSIGKDEFFNYTPDQMHSMAQQFVVDVSTL